MAKYDNITPTQNTLWNSDSSGQIAYAEQLKDALIDWTNAAKKYNGQYENPDFDPEQPIGPDNPQYLPIIPTAFKTEANKFQSRLNEFFLNHWADFQTFLHDHDLEDETVNTWRELQDFLKGLPDDEAAWLLETVTNLSDRITAMDIPDGGAYDVSADHVSGGQYAKYESLANALAAISTDDRKSGMSVRFINSTTNKYEQWRYMLEYDNTAAGNTAFTIVSNWQGIDDEPTAGSDNLVKSGGVLSGLNEKINSYPSVNLFNPDDIDVKLGYYLDGNVLVEHSSYNVSGFIKVIPETLYSQSTTAGQFTTSGFRYVSFYNSDKEYISNIGTSTEFLGSFTTPQNCYYVRVTFYVSTYNYAQVSQGTAKTYVNYNPIGGYTAENYKNNSIGEQAIKTDSISLQRLGTDVIGNLVETIRTTNLYNPVNYVDDQGIDNSGYIFGNAGWSRTGYIPVEAGESYYITASNITRTTGLRWEDGNHNFISGGGNNIFNTVLVAPANAAYLIFNLSNANNNKATNVMMIKGTSAAAAYVPFNKIKSEQIEGLEDKINVSAGANLFNPDDKDVLIGYYINSGYIGGGGTSNYNSSGYIEVSAETSYYSTSSVNAGFRFVNFYNQNKQFLSGIATEATLYFTTPQNCKYVRITFYAHSYSYAQVTAGSRKPYEKYTPIGGYQAQQYKSGSVNTDAISNKAITLNKINDEVKNILLDTSRTTNLCNPLIFIPNIGISNTGYLDTSLTNWAVSGYIPVEAGESYYITAKNIQRSTNLIWLNSSKARISGGDSKIFNTVLTAPANAAYLIFVVSVDCITYTEDIMMVKGTSGVPYVPYNQIKPEQIVGLEGGIGGLGNSLRGKKWVACGDSFTQGSGLPTFEDTPYKGYNKSYPYWIGRRTGMVVINEAQGGSTMTYIEGRGGFSAENGRYTQIPADTDYITLYFGINDDNQSVTIGTINDEVNTTFYGAWNIVMRYLITNHPYAHIGIIITNGASNEIMTAERNIAKKWGIPYLDYADEQTPLMNRMSGMREGVCSEAINLRQNAFIVGNGDTHPNEHAHEYESTFIEAFLRRL